MDPKKTLVNKIINEVDGTVFSNSRLFRNSEKTFLRGRYLKMLTLMPEMSADSIGLEIGLYSGMLAIAVKRNFKLRELYSLDHPTVIKKYAKEFLVKLKKENIIVKPVDLHSNNLPWPSGYFDFIICSEVIEHLVPSDSPRLFKEIKRVLKENGWALITTPNATSLIKRANMLRGKNPFEFDLTIHDGATFGHMREYTLYELESIVKDAGFQIVSKRYFTIDGSRNLFTKIEKIVSYAVPFCANSLFLLVKKT